MNNNLAITLKKIISTDNAEHKDFLAIFHAQDDLAITEAVEKMSPSELAVANENDDLFGLVASYASTEKIILAIKAFGKKFKAVSKVSFDEYSTPRRHLETFLVSIINEDTPDEKADEIAEAISELDFCDELLSFLSLDASENSIFLSKDPLYFPEKNTWEHIAYLVKKFNEPAFLRARDAIRDIHNDPQGDDQCGKQMLAAEFLNTYRDGNEDGGNVPKTIFIDL